MRISGIFQTSKQDADASFFVDYAVQHRVQLCFAGFAEASELSRVLSEKMDANSLQTHREKVWLIFGNQL